MNVLRLGCVGLGAMSVGTGIGVWSGGQPVIGAAVGFGGVGLAAVVGVVLGKHPTSRPSEPELIEELDEPRRRELIRGTSMHLRDMKYRYSIRYDRTDRESFTAEVNSVTLGFVPIVILENDSERQGLGYAAFPYDGRRWRGPGLPCGGDPAGALDHAARCVAPLEDGDADVDGEPDDDALAQ